MQRAFVTGGTGFIGGHLVRRLLDMGVETRCLVRPDSPLRGLDGLPVEIVRGQLLDEALLRRELQSVDVVFHVAGLIAALRKQDFVDINARACGLIAESCARCESPPVLVCLSSLAAAGPSGRVLRTEERRPAPVSEYGKSKRMGEMLANRWADQVPITVIRPGIVYGPHDRALLPAFAAIKRLGVHVVPTWEPPQLSLVHATDLVQLTCKAATDGKRVTLDEEQTGVYHACTDEHPNYLELGRLIARAVGRDHVLLLPLVQPLPWIIGSLGDVVSRIRGKAFPLNLDKMREASVPSWVTKPDKAKTELDFAPSKPLEEHLQELGDWYTAAGWM